MELLTTLFYVHVFIFICSLVVMAYRFRKYSRFDKAPFWFSLLLPLLGPLLTLIILVNDELSGAGSARYIGQNLEEGSQAHRALQMFLK